MKVKIKDILRDISWFIKNIIYYYKWLWNSRDYDYNWLLEIMLLYMKKMQMHNKKCAFGRNEPSLNEAIDLLDKIIKDEWIEQEDLAHDKKWGKLKLKSNKKGTVQFKRRKANTPQKKEQERKERLKLYDLEAKRQKQAISRFTHLFKNHHRKWWC